MSERKACCTPPRGASALPSDATAFGARSVADFDTVLVLAGQSLIGTAEPLIPDDGEGPLRKSRHKAFHISTGTVSNTEFAAFVKETGYVTEAERFGWSFVFWSDVPEGIPEGTPFPGAEWWQRIDGANWRDIHGPGSHNGHWHADHPVVQVSLQDATAYATWAGGRLPTEAEWEAAARGGRGDVRFPWGQAAPDDQTHLPCNIWQGDFPHLNTGADGYRHTAPVRSYEPNAIGLYNMVGNVWEWTADVFRIKSMKKAVKARLAGMQGYQVSKGGSYLCHKSYCYRYRIAARSGSSPDSATPHHGFRVVWDASPARLASHRQSE